MTQPSTPRYASGTSDGSLSKATFSPSQLPFSALEKHFLGVKSPSDFSATSPTRQNGKPNGARADDSVGTHLLVSTAIVESSKYPILSLEEVEDLQKELQSLTNRIDSATRKLSLEAKVRDAAQSLSRLYQRKGPPRRKSILSVSSNASENGVSGRTDEEFNASERKCEELTRELWTLTNRASDIQKRLLQHNVGILGSTHSGNTTTNGISKDEPGDGLMRSEQQTVPPETVDKLARLTKRMDTLLRTIGNCEGKPVVQGLGPKGESVEDSLARLEAGIAAVEERNKSDGANESNLNSIGKQMWDLVMACDSDYRNKKEARIPDYDDEEDDSEDEDDFNDSDPYEMRRLVQKVQRICAHRAKLSEDKSRLRRTMVELRRGFETELDELKVQYDERMDEVSVDLKDMETQLEQLGLQSSDAERRAQAAEEELKRMQAALTQKEVELKQVAEGEISALNAQQQAATRELDELRAAVKARDEEFNALEGETKARDDEVRGLRDQLEATTQQLEITKEQLHAQAGMQDQLQAVTQQLEITKAQLEAQAEELNEKAQLEDDLDEERGAHQNTRQEFTSRLQERDTELSELRSQVEELQQSLDELQQGREKLQAELSAVISDREAQIKSLEEKVSTLESNKLDWEARIAESSAKEQQLTADISERDAKLAKMDGDMRELEEAVARFSTEAVILKAELDSVHGSRQQRAAETAEAKAAALALEKAGKADPTLISQIDTLKAQNDKLNIEATQLTAAREQYLSEIDNLRSQLAAYQSQVDRSPPLPSPPIHEFKENETLESRCAMLQAELDGMLSDFELLTAQSLEHEVERRALEEHIDKLRDRIDTLESALADERIKGLGADAPQESRSTIVLKNEFKKMMRDMRAESLKSLRAEQEERRKLESTIRALKKEAMGSRRQTASSMHTISTPPMMPMSPPPPKIVAT